MQTRGRPAEGDSPASAAKAGSAVNAARAAIAIWCERRHARRRVVIGNGAAGATGNAQASDAGRREFGVGGHEAVPRPYQMSRGLPCRHSADMLGRRSLVACGALLAPRAALAGEL